MNQPDVFSKIEELKEVFKTGRPDFRAIIKGLEVEMREAFMRANLGTHPVIESYTKGLIEVINTINNRLLNEVGLEKDARDRMLETRDLYQGFINVFVKSPDHLKQIIKKVEEIIEANKK